MNKINELLEERFSSSQSHTKVKALARQSNDGSLSSFSGFFKAQELPENVKLALQELLQSFSPEAKVDIKNDLQELAKITSEVRAINNQAAVLHGERILRAQKLLKSYKEGAFSAWLVSTYGNRQTPYNFLLYYEFLQILPQELKHKAECMPRQAIYILASRDVPIEQKREVVESYNGQTKREMVEYIRETFPLPENDKRKPLAGQKILAELTRTLHLIEKEHAALRTTERKEIERLLRHMLSRLS
jgi:hypothetical protein